MLLQDDHAVAKPSAKLPPPGEPMSQLFARGVETDGVRRVLRIVRKHLKMDVAFVSRFGGGERVLEHVDDDGNGPIAVGQRMAMEDGYCLKVVNGELPACIPDTARVPAALRIPATRALPIGSHLSVPVRLDSGELYGTLCCFGYQAREELDGRDLQIMQAFAEVLGYRVDETIAAERLQRRTSDEIGALLARGAPRIVFQPIHRLDDGTLSGFECLSRFEVEPRRRPEDWFGAAHRAGLGIELELQAIGNALLAQARLPRELYVAVNASAELLLSGRLESLLPRFDFARTVVELTEHAVVDDYGGLSAALQPWRDRGLRLAIDDAGAGYSSMRHILRLDPDIIKLDMSLTHDVDCDWKRRALAKGLTSFAHDIGSQVTAEGVETEGELATLRELGVDAAQGYHLARPQSLEDAVLRATNARRSEAA